MTHSIHDISFINLQIYISFELCDLKALIAVAQAGSFTKAASNLVSHPTFIEELNMHFTGESQQRREYE